MEFLYKTLHNDISGLPVLPEALQTLLLISQPPRGPRMQMLVQKLSRSLNTESIPHKFDQSVSTYPSEVKIRLFTHSWRNETGKKPNATSNKYINFQERPVLISKSDVIKSRSFPFHLVEALGRFWTFFVKLSNYGQIFISCSLINACRPTFFANFGLFLPITRV